MLATIRYAIVFINYRQLKHTKVVERYANNREILRNYKLSEKNATRLYREKVQLEIIVSKKVT